MTRVGGQKRENYRPEVTSFNHFRVPKVCLGENFDLQRERFETDMIL